MDEYARQRQFEVDRVRQEDLIAQCMNELGFEYIPYLGWHTFSPASGAWQPDDPDWVAEFGFGVTTSPPGGSGVSGSGIDILNLGPNNGVLEAMSEEGRLAWLGAFHRSGAGWERTIGTIDFTFRDCGNWSWNLIQYEHQLVNTEEFAPLLDAIAQMHHDLQWDITDAERDWAICMADTGYVGFDSPWHASDSVVQEYNALRTWLAAEPDWDYGNPTAENSPEFAALQIHERELATTSLKCRISTDFEAKRDAHIHAVENQFITDNRAALAALRDAAEQRG